jgi:hypothetical protein
MSCGYDANTGVYKVKSNGSLPQPVMTIADKCLRYSKYFKQGIIIVLFNVLVNQYRYKDWLETLNETFPQAVVIKK